MALVRCHECTKEISDQAQACPQCGVPRIFQAKPIHKHRSTAERTVRALLGFFLVVVVAVSCQSLFDTSNTPKKAKATETTKAPQDSCKVDDLRCLGEKAAPAASVYCVRPIERSAKHSVKWTDGLLEPKFSYFRWANRKAGTLTFVGDKAEFQNGFGAYTPVIYECDLAKDGETVIAVRVREGRLDN